MRLPLLIAFILLSVSAYTERDPKEHCYLPKNEGTCLSYNPRYYYDSTDGKCKQFLSCHVNTNDFATEQECQQACKGVPPTTTKPPKTTKPPTTSIPTTTEKLPRCLQPMDGGYCKAAWPRFFYNASLGACQAFTFGGCGGNDNNFGKTEECEAACKGVTAKPQPTTQLPQCLQPKKLGSCGKNLTRFYYDATLAKCRGFSYGGCEPNENNFVTEQECQAACKGVTTPTPTKAPPTASDCFIVDRPLFQCYIGMLKNVTAFFYDASSGVCKGFAYDGCPGRKNIFFKKENCEKTCKGVRVPTIVTTRPTTTRSPPTAKDCLIIDEPKWDCFMAIPAYVYDASNGVCKNYTYGGCAEMRNLFFKKADCETTCKGVRRPTTTTVSVKPTTTSIPTTPKVRSGCYPPLERRGCFGNNEITAYYYDAQLGTCYKGVGCKGDKQNILSTKEACEAECKRERLPTNTTVSVKPTTSSLPNTPKDARQCVQYISTMDCLNGTSVYFYNTDLGVCYEDYKCQTASKKHFFTKEDCEATCKNKAPSNSVARSIE